MWNDFTNLYSLSKTLRFELVPDPATQAALEASGTVETDRQRHQQFRLAKQALDVIHRQFIADSLAGVTLDASALEAYITAALDKSVSASALAKQAQPLLRRFADSFAATSTDWQERYRLKKPFITSSESQLSLLTPFQNRVAEALKIPRDEVQDIQAAFNNFAAYFTGYLDNRKNCYTTEGKATEVASRAIVQNLLKFHKNRQKYAAYQDNGLLVVPPDYQPLFDIAQYVNYLTQDGITAYNRAIGELNSLVNQTRQAQTGYDKSARSHLPLFEPLFKQILGESTSRAYFEALASAEEYRQLMAQLQQQLPAWLEQLQTHFAAHITNPAAPSQVYLGARAVNTLLAKHIEPDSINSIRSRLPETFKPAARGSSDTAAPATHFVSLHDLFTAIDDTQAAAAGVSVVRDETAVPGQPARLVWQQFCGNLQAALTAAAPVVHEFTQLTAFDNAAKEPVKLALDTFNDVYRLYTYFELRYKNEPVTALDFDAEFYAIFQDAGDQASLFDTDKDRRFPHAYDLVRNWLTKKPYSLEKWKLNFDCSILLDGWDLNKEPEKHGTILTHAGRYYLAVLTNSHNKAFDKTKNSELFSAGDTGWQKMEYKLLPGANKMLPKCLFSEKYRKNHNVPAEVDALYQNNEHIISSPTFSLASLHHLINFYKAAMPTYEGWSMYSFSFRDTAEYTSIDQFYHEVENSGYRLDFVDINPDALRELVNAGHIYLFTISNKDLAAGGSGRANIHTAIFRQLFQPDSKVKLGGGAEVFFRPKSLDAAAAPRRTPQGSQVIENRRFTQDKYFLHVPATLNYQTKSLVNSTFNQHAIERIKTNQVKAVIGIDRGEKHLAYIAVVDQNGRLLDEPVSLNHITSRTPAGREFATDYWTLLEQCERDRKANRQNWEAVRKIKDLKDGYVGHCVKTVVDLMLKHHAVIALEDLNRGFKQGRSAIERSTYNQFEQALLKKLQYVTNKTAAPLDAFGIQNGVQLAPPDIAPKDVRNHMGFVFYVDPSYTSALDPVTGYRQQFSLDDRVNAGTFTRLIADGFETIGYQDGYLTLSFNWRQLAKTYNQLKPSAAKRQAKAGTSDYPGLPWTITLNVPRAIYYKDRAGQPHTDIVYPQAELVRELETAGVTIEGNIKARLTALKPTAQLAKSFARAFNRANRLRNTIDGQDTIISPVYPHGFDSRTQTYAGYDWNGDANGAFNIARKGALLLQQLYAAQTPKDFTCRVDQQTYDAFVTSQPVPTRAAR